MSEESITRADYAVEFSVTLRNFMGQKTGSSLEENVKIGASDLNDFKHKLWLNIQEHLKREIIYVNNVPCWSEKETPEEIDVHKFVGFVDGKGKRNYSLAAVSEVDLTRWRDRIVPMNVYTYSVTVASRSHWTQVERVLIKPAEVDRAGAASMNEIANMVVQLKEIHGAQYRGTDITWQQWANYVLRQDAHAQSNLIREPPPTHLIHFFSHTRTDADDLVAQIRQNLCIGERVNRGIDLEVSVLRSAFNNMKGTVLTLFDDFDRRLTALEDKLATNQNLLDGFQEAVGVEENEFGVQEFENIVNMEDIDHM